MHSIGWCHRTRTSLKLLAVRPFQLTNLARRSDSSKPKPESENADFKSYYYPNTPVGINERNVKSDRQQPEKPLQTPYPPFPGGKNPKTGELDGPTGPEPTRFGDWERKGRVTDF